MKNQISHKTALIKCPNCGCEYLPGEIYMPGSLIGQPGGIVRDSLGKILYEDYLEKKDEPDNIEHFICEHCEKPFIIEATVSYKTYQEAPEKDFTEKYVSLLD